MIIYDPRKVFGYDLLFHATGSALYNWHSLPQACLSGTIAAILSNDVVANEWLQGRIANAHVFYGGFSFIVGFVIVIRVQVSMERYYKAQQSFFEMSSKLSNLASMCSACMCGNRGDDVKTSLDIHSTIMRWVKLYYTTALEEFQGFEFSEHHKNHCDIVTDEEEELLESEHNRPIVVMSWISKALIKHRSCFNIGDPGVARMLQIMSDVDLAYSQTRRVAETPFPFALAQCSTMIIHIWAILSPIFIGCFIRDSYGLAFAVAFSGAWILFGVNEVSAQLEGPFEEAANDLPLVHYQISFMDGINAIGNWKTIPSMLRSESDDDDGDGSSASTSAHDHSENSKGSHKTKSLEKMTIRRDRRSLSTTEIDISHKMSDSSVQLLNLFKQPEREISSPTPRPITFGESADDQFGNLKSEDIEDDISEPVRFNTVAATEGARMALQLKNERDRIRREIAMQAFQENQSKRRQRSYMRHQFSMVTSSPKTVSSRSTEPADQSEDIHVHIDTTESHGAGEARVASTRSRSSRLKRWARFRKSSRRSTALEFSMKEENFTGLVELRSRGAFRNIL